MLNRNINKLERNHVLLASDAYANVYIAKTFLIVLDNFYLAICKLEFEIIILIIRLFIR